MLMLVVRRCAPAEVVPAPPYFAFEPDVLKPGLLPHLAHGCSSRILAGLDPTTGWKPEHRAVNGIRAAQQQQALLLVEQQHTGSQPDRGGAHTSSLRRSYPWIAARRRLPIVWPMETSGVPRLQTVRLVLREWQTTDADAYAAMTADPEVMRYLGGVKDHEQSWRAMAVHAGHWTLRGYGNWVVERASDGEFLGRVGLWYPEGWLGLEIGWTLARNAWGNGYATEAARAAMDWA
jgi:RimJ/RimL family protein N-acetyltransferase